jgi:2-polyprenyl-6-methoxyphenol hydroxylase-like FAD-dependent oxidoreductase
LHRGIAYPEPLGFGYNITPGVGEVFQAPFFSFEGRVTALAWEAVPGGPFEALTRMRYEDDPQKFEATELALLRDYVPDTYARVNLAEFGITRSLDVLQGAITPVVRRGYARLGNGKYVVAIGDVSVLIDPITGQGANTASRSAWTLGEAILAGGRFDEEFCREVEARIWDYAQSVTARCNAALQPPQPYARDFFIAAAQDQRVADAFVGAFNDPPQLWSMLSSREAVDAALLRLQKASKQISEELAGLPPEEAAVLALLHKRLGEEAKQK